MADFFISYNKSDRGWAEWIGWQLEEAGYTVILQAWDFRPGGNFALDMQRAAAESERTIAVLSPDYLASLFTAPEWAAAFAQDPTGEKGLLLPVRARACDPKGLLPQIVYIDLVGVDEKTAIERLLTGVSRERAKPAVAPPFPGAAPAPRTIAERPTFPNERAAIWNVPHDRNLNFTGREDELAQIETALRSGQSAALTQTLSGLGGVGKTQLAVEYPYRHAAEYRVVWWLRAEQPTTLAADYARLAQELGLPEKDSADQPAAIDAVRRWLERNNGWLLIFDNANESQEVQPYRPRGGSGHVLITSRNPVWRSTANPLTVEELPRDRSVEFLLRRTGRSDADAAAKLADALGDLPLALEQAGAYIEATGTTLAAYVDLFEQYQLALLDEQPPSGDYPHSIGTTWNLAFEQVHQQSPAAVDLLNLCAFLAPDDIPLSIIRDGSKRLPEPLATMVQEGRALNRALAALLRYSLIERRDDLLSVHRMVQAVTRDKLDVESRKLWAGAAVQVVDDAFPFDSDDVRTWGECARLLPHALLATNHAEQPDASLQSIAHLLNQTGLYLQGRGEFMAARVAFERALRIGEQVYGPEHPEVAAIINNLGLVLRNLGDLEGARSMSERALRIGEQVYGSEHPTVAIVLNNLGTVLHDLGDFDGARATHDRALRIDEQVYGSEHPTVAIAINNLGTVLHDLGDLEGARAAYERAIRIQEKVYISEHPNVATVLNNLAEVLRDLGDLRGSQAAFERALGIWHIFLGDDHPNTRTVRSSLEVIIREQQEQAGNE